MEAGASTDIIVRALDLIGECFGTHAAREEEFLRNHGSDVASHAAAHEFLNARIRAVRTLFASGEPEAVLDALDLLALMHHHVKADDAAAYEQVLRHSERYGADKQHRTVELARLARMRAGC